MKAINKSLLMLAVLFLAVPAMAQDAAHVATAVGGGVGFVGIGIGIAMGFAVLGGALGQGKAAAAALEGIARNPAVADKLQGPLILSLAFMESLVLFAFLISLLLELSVGGALGIVK
jgi:F-type H+-transporting ATPase subunit c